MSSSTHSSPWWLRYPVTRSGYSTWTGGTPPPWTSSGGGGISRCTSGVSRSSTCLWSPLVAPSSLGSWSPSYSPPCCTSSSFQVRDNFDKLEGIWKGHVRCVWLMSMFPVPICICGHFAFVTFLSQGIFCKISSLWTKKFGPTAGNILVRVSQKSSKKSIVSVEGMGCPHIWQFNRGCDLLPACCSLFALNGKSV